PTKLVVRLSKEDQIYELIVERMHEVFKNRILIPQNDRDKMTKNHKVLDKFEQQKMEFEKRQQQNTTNDKTLEHNNVSSANNNVVNDDHHLIYFNLTETISDSIQESANDYDEYKKAQNKILDDMETEGVSNNEETTTHGNHFSESNINKDIKEP